MNRHTIATVWEEHCADAWPQFSSPHQGELMTLDTVISGCVVFYLDGADALDPQRAGIIKDCVGDLAELTADLEQDTQRYFLRLKQLGELLLAAGA
jgi:hypothetical protein